MVSGRRATDMPGERGLDVAIVGGGPAGLVAALYLARFNRALRLFDGGMSRAQWIGRSLNIPGFPDGISGADYLAALLDQLAAYPVEPVRAAVTGLGRDGDRFLVEAGGQTCRAGSVILATGREDKLPEINGIREALRAGIVAVCPVCHAYESNGRHVAVLADGPQGIGEARFLANHAASVTVLDVSSGGLALPDDGIGLRRAPPGSTQIADSRIRHTSPEGDLWFDQLYVALGCRLRSDLAVAAGARLDEDGSVIVDPYLETSVKGLFAIGDLASGLDQISVAAGHAAIAATHINARLLGAAE